MPGVAPASVHLIVTSPPYPMIPQWDALFDRLGARDYAAMHEVLGEVWRRCLEVLVPGGLLAVNIGDALRTLEGEFRLWPNHARVLEQCEALGFRPLPYILWKKPTNRPNAFLGSGFSPPNAYVTLDCEYVLLFRKGGLRRFPSKDAARARSRYSRAERDRWFSQIWSGVRGVRQEARGARTGAFPAEIPERLIRMFSCVGETVLDPFAGTGTTLWAAARLGRSAIGIEIDPALAERLRDSERREAVARPPAPRGAEPPRRPRAAGSAARGR
ncbi:MAG: site-specific DNA-methyltransferase [Thermoplasmata archaeon]|nr:site-specific DNA-methyltransferase [Thermoplasmata archaeon]MCI4354027.1 site-specific DNA-methyltransferase [Thermoplasmata archaeon]